uniref:Uncharacterized protein n=1 Tax=Periophthalmus magnuspinnatus TaxID=409849 RepID=A0A3B4AEM6_9GOBI
MDAGVVDNPVTLVIRAPNQKYGDQTINCFQNWTVEKLKAHLSDVYPSKPVRRPYFLLSHEGHCNAVTMYCMRLCF